MANYGGRYLSITNFRSYCADIKTRSQPDCSELELYEKEGVLLPVARIIKPDEYVIKRKQTDQQAGGNFHPITYYLRVCRYTA